MEFAEPAKFALIAGIILATIPILIQVVKSTKRMKIRTGFYALGALTGIAIFFGIPIVQPQRPLIVKEIHEPNEKETEETSDSGICLQDDSGSG